MTLFCSDVWRGLSMSACAAAACNRCGLPGSGARGCSIAPLVSICRSPRRRAAAAYRCIGEAAQRPPEASSAAAILEQALLSGLYRPSRPSHPSSHPPTASAPQLSARSLQTATSLPELGGGCSSAVPAPRAGSRACLGSCTQYHPHHGSAARLSGCQADTASAARCAVAIVKARSFAARRVTCS